MVGTIGTAPAAGAAPSLRYGADHGGNVDCPAAGPGAVLRLPVNAPGALLSVGDVHALMGDAEIAGTALETSADVTVRLRIRPAAGTVGHGPTLDDPEHIGVIGCVDQADLTGNIEAAMLALHHRLCHEYALPPVDAYDLLGALARIRVNQRGRRMVQCVRRRPARVPPVAGRRRRLTVLARHLGPGPPLFHNGASSSVVFQDWLGSRRPLWSRATSSRACLTTNLGR